MAKKDNILVVVNRGAAELDWLMPILFVLKKNLYYFFKKIKSEFYIKSNLENFFLRLLRLLLHSFINFKFAFNFIEYLNDRINNVVKFSNKNIIFSIGFF